MTPLPHRRSVAAALPAIFREEEPATGVAPGAYLRSIFSGESPEDDPGYHGHWVLLLEPPPEGRPPDVLPASFFHDGSSVAKGEAKLEGNQVTFVTTGTGEASPPGRYRWATGRRSVTLEPVSDPSVWRRSVLTSGPLSRQSFVERFVAAFDDALVPVFEALDNVHAYLDPRTAPVGFLDWLGSWVGLRPHETWPVEKRRERIARAAELFRWWGTADAIRDYVAVFTGLEPADVEVADNGGVAASSTHGAALPGTPEARVIVKVRPPDPTVLDPVELDKVVASAKPAHVLHEVEVAPR
ncbi:MAG: phage tail protein [Actinomycetota bacterium]